MTDAQRMRRLQGTGRTEVRPEESPALPDDHQVNLTLFLRSPLPEPSPSEPVVRLAHHDFARLRGASFHDIETTMAAIRSFDLVMTDLHQPSRRLHARGSARDIQRAFGITLRQTPEGHIAHIEDIVLPEPLHMTVVAVLGTDTTPMLRAQIRPQLNPGAGYLPTDVAHVYRYPLQNGGKGECVGIIELGGGFESSDLSTYFASQGQSLPAIAVIGVDGASNAPTGSPSSADGEVVLDIEIIGSLVPQAQIAVYFAPNTNQGFANALATALHDTTHRPSALSISWGAPESSYSPSAISALSAQLADAAQLGVTVAVAAGDNGATDGVNDGSDHVDFPASSPWSLACGGTRLESNGTIRLSETVWNDLPQGGATGGGVSTLFNLPAYQQSANVPPSASGFIGRGVPDVAGDADPQTGYRIRVDGTDTVFGGTSAVAPLWSALITLINSGRSTPLGFVNPSLYQLGEADFYDITSGGNGGYQASTGWDPCTGLGTPDGTALETHL
ncbi:MAG: S53 family peptidase [Acidimicrobiales bacterium]